MLFSLSDGLVFRRGGGTIRSHVAVRDYADQPLHFL